MKRFFSLLFLLVVVSNVFSQKDNTVVKTNTGLISGIQNKESNIYIYKGIPFAAPPVAALRWKTPQPVTPWTGIKKCETFGASAPQGKPVPFSMYTSEFLIPEEPINEDCLYLNVWTSSIKSTSKKPVIVWIHGGAFISGSGSCPIYDGENMAKKGVVFVTINYRLGVFGFLAHPELTKESPTHSSGNYAFLDQVEALKWVKKNIAAFGGDPNRVTIAGQSAGSFSVNALAASPIAKGLFQRVIAESGGMFNTDERTLTLPIAEQNGIKILEKVKTSSIAEMRNMPADDLAKAVGYGMVGPVIDGYVLPENIYNIYSQGKQNDVPVLTGWNRDEGFAPPNTPSPEDYKTSAQKKYGELADAFLSAYPGNTTDEIKRSQVVLARNTTFAWHAYTWARLQTAKQKNKVFLYQFDKVPPENEQYGAFHSAEIAYALNSLHTWHRPWTEADKNIENIMSSYWVNFAANGDPNGKGLPLWKPYSTRQNALMEFEEKEIDMKSIDGLSGFEFIDKWQKHLNEKK
ncbi:MAG: carboxylesterase family protein [Sphingobacteriales bacterium]|nr:carboxylesterase family protein [Sphingobacteriales bacterium]MBI3720530.1 carboxylesterase family protein [Sphingobacteriales bacterium]